MRPLPVTLLTFGLAAGPHMGAAQWSLSADVGVAYFGGTSRDSSGATVGPYRPTTFAVRVDHGDGPVRFGLHVLYAEPGLAGKQGDLAFVQSGVLSLWEIVPQVAVRVVRFGTGVEGRIEAGPAFYLWEFDNEQRNRVAARGPVALQWPLARSLTGSLRVGGVCGESVSDAGGVAACFDRVTARRFDVGVGLRNAL